MIDILLELAKIAPIIALLIAAVIYFLKREKLKEAEIKELNEYIRASEKENLIILNKVTTTLDKVVDQDASNTEKILLEMRATKENINTKIDNISK